MTARTGDEARPSLSRPLVRAVIVVIFALLLAWDVWEAVGNLLGVTGTATALGTTVSPTGWFVLCFGVVLPIAGFVGVLWFGRRARPTTLLIAFATVTTVVAALSLDLLAIYGIGTLLV
jgi:FtsH-binding integral membrane protein